MANPFKLIKNNITIVKLYNLCFMNIVLLTILILPSCVNNPTSTCNNKTLFIGFFSQNKSYWDPINKLSIDSNNISHTSYTLSSPMVHNVIVNVNDTLPDILWNKSYTKGGIESSFYSSYYDYASVTISSVYFVNSFNKSKNISIFSDNDSSYIEISFPSVANIISHALYDTISLDSNIILRWEGEADWYYVQLIYVDTSGYVKGGRDTCMIDQTLEILKESIKKNVAKIYVEITGTNGPLPTKGSNGNITGDIEGFVYTYNNIADDTVNNFTHLYISGTKHSNKWGMCTLLPTAKRALQDFIQTKVY